MTRDHFPTTHQTWLSERVGVANDEVARHVMQRYFEPLRAYVKGSSLLSFGDSADLVNDFFAARLGDPTYLERWIDSGLPLRRWLVNGLLLHVRNRGIAEGRRRARVDAGVGGAKPRARLQLHRVLSGGTSEHYRCARRPRPRATAQNESSTSSGHEAGAARQPCVPPAAQARRNGGSEAHSRLLSTFQSLLSPTAGGRRRHAGRSPVPA